MAKKCIDISAWQGKVGTDTFNKNKGKIPFVILRSSYTTQKGFNLYEDKVFENNIKTAYKAGMQIGIYHYSQATSVAEAKKEAQFVIKVIKPYKDKVTLPVAFDWEFGGRLSSWVAKELGKAGCKKLCDAFCNEIKNAGFETMVYANLSTLNAYLPSDLYKSWPIWVAQYHSRCDYKHPYVCWQYTSSGSVSGLPGRIDMNYYYGSAKEQQEHEEAKPKGKYTGELPKLPKRGWFTSGDKGAEVKKMQKFLNWYGDYGLDVDGEVGRKTMEAVRYYEGREKIKPVDGLFGKKCLERAKTVER